MRISAISAILGVTLAGSVTLIAAPAAVAAPDITIWPRVTQPHVAIQSSGCREVPMTVGYASSGVVEYASVRTEVWRGDTNTGSASFYGEGNGGGRGVLGGYYYYCPYEGLGTFRAGPSTVEWFDEDYNDYTASDSEYVYFTVRQASRFKSAKMTRKGKTRTFKAKAQFFSIETSSWESMRRGSKVKLERRTSNGSWRYVKSARVGKSGAVKVSTKTSSKRVYRLTASASSKVWGGNSKSIRK